MERAAGWGAVAGAGTADHAGGHGLVEPPAVGLGGGVVRYIRYIRYIAGQPCSGSVGACRYIRYIARSCSGCSGSVFVIRYRLAAGLAWGFIVL